MLRGKTRLVLPPLLLGGAVPALGHDGSPHDPGWTLDPWVTAPLLLGSAIYGIGLYRLWRRSGLGRPGLRREAGLFALGWLSLAGALVSPLHEAGERSFTMHMIEHEIIMLVAALLIAAGRPGPAFLWGLPGGVRRAAGAFSRWPLWRRLGSPVTATLLQGAAIWAWHVPVLFDLALREEGWHIAQHLCFILTALLFWWSMLHAPRRGAGHGIAALCLFATSLIGGALGALMALSASPWYDGYARLGMTPYGLDPAEDQQLAGLLMWIPGGMVHLLAALFFLHRWLDEHSKDPPLAAR